MNIFQLLNILKVLVHLKNLNNIEHKVTQKFLPESRNSYPKP